MEKAQFTIDDGNHYEGIHDPSIRWNGWACPFFDFRTSVKILMNGLTDWEFFEDRQVFQVRLHDEPEGEYSEFEGQMIDGVMMYPIGAFSWVWDEIS